ncbi:MAG: CDP-glucose 4,6-dehydratase [Pseudomonadales bacterium]|nr:CDP-glucose 4,6-dehydratase [Pseudomonadales bacterium]
MIDPNFWLGRKIFLTGHTGFKGSWLSLWLNKLGADVTGYALAPATEQSIYNSAAVEQSLNHSVCADIRDLATLTKSMQEIEPEIVIHMAAQSLVRESYANPVETYGTNVMGTVNLFEAVRNTPSVRAVLNITTDKCYENIEKAEGYQENEPMGGHDPYSSSKGCAELISSAYRRSFFQQAGIALATARAGNVIGGGDWAADRIVPDAMRAFMDNKPLLIRNPMAVRPWQHVLEPLAGYLLLCQQLINQPHSFEESWNFGPTNEDTQDVSALANIMVKAWGDNARWQQDATEHPHEALVLKLDCSKAETSLNWAPVWNLKSALEKTVLWYKVWHKHGDTHQVTLDQIEAYQQEHISR